MLLQEGFKCPEAEPSLDTVKSGLKHNVVFQPLGSTCTATVSPASVSLVDEASCSVSGLILNKFSLDTLIKESGHFKEPGISLSYYLQMRSW